jgi:hypothetical protein
VIPYEVIEVAADDIEIIEIGVPGPRGGPGVSIKGDKGDKGDAGAGVQDVPNLQLDGGYF